MEIIFIKIGYANAYSETDDNGEIHYNHEEVQGSGRYPDVKVKGPDYWTDQPFEYWMVRFSSEEEKKKKIGFLTELYLEKDDFYENKVTEKDGSILIESISWEYLDTSHIHTLTEVSAEDIPIDIHVL